MLASLRPATESLPPQLARRSLRTMPPLRRRRLLRPSRTPTALDDIRTELEDPIRVLDRRVNKGGAAAVDIGPDGLMTGCGGMKFGSDGFVWGRHLDGRGGARTLQLWDKRAEAFVDEERKLIYSSRRERARAPAPKAPPQEEVVCPVDGRPDWGGAADWHLQNVAWERAWEEEDEEHAPPQDSMWLHLDFENEKTRAWLGARHMGHKLIEDLARSEKMTQPELDLGKFSSRPNLDCKIRGLNHPDPKTGQAMEDMVALRMKLVRPATRQLSGSGLVKSTTFITTIVVDRPRDC